MTAKPQEKDEITTGATESAIKSDKQRKLKIYGSVVTALLFGAIGVYALLASHAATRSQMWSGQTLYAGQSMTAESNTKNNTSKYTLVMQTDGNLVIYNSAGHATWNTHTAHTGSHNHLAFQGDGNLVLYSGSRALWSSGTRGVGPRAVFDTLTLQTDGNLVIYTSGYDHYKQTPIWSVYTGQIFYNTVSINTGQSLNAGQILVSRNSKPGYKLIMQTDGNLVIYNAYHHAVWNTHTAHTGSHNRLVMQSDGNLVLYSGSRPLWSSRTNGRGIGVSGLFETLTLSNIGKGMLISYGGSPLWSSTNTHITNMLWTTAGMLPSALSLAKLQAGGYKCTQISEPSDPYTWNDNYLCTEPHPPVNLALAWTYYANNPGTQTNGSYSVKLLGVWGYKYCTSWNIAGEPSSYTWSDDYLCMAQDRPDGSPFLQLASAPRGNEYCTLINEIADPYFGPHYLCQP